MHRAWCAWLLFTQKYARTPRRPALRGSPCHVSRVREQCGGGGPPGDQQPARAGREVGPLRAHGSGAAQGSAARGHHALGGARRHGVRVAAARRVVACGAAHAHVHLGAAARRPVARNLPRRSGRLLLLRRRHGAAAAVVGTAASLDRSGRGSPLAPARPDATLSQQRGRAVQRRGHRLLRDECHRQDRRAAPPPLPRAACTRNGGAGRAVAAANGDTVERALRARVGCHRGGARARARRPHLCVVGDGVACEAAGARRGSEPLATHAGGRARAEPCPVLLLPRVAPAVARGVRQRANVPGDSVPLASRTGRRLHGQPRDAGGSIGAGRIRRTATFVLGVRAHEADVRRPLGAQSQGAHCRP